MNILIPMAGDGKRFSEQGYTIHKPILPTVFRKNGLTLPMVICAALDLPGVENFGENIIFVDRLFDKKDGVENTIKDYFPKASFITVAKLTQGQAATCLLAKEQIDGEQELLIAGCDNGMVIDIQKFNKAKKQTDCLVFTYRNNEAVMNNPNAYGWVEVDENFNITNISIKKAISKTPINDHAIVATFWFKHGGSFVSAAEKMIKENNRINNEFYVDGVIKHLLEQGYSAKAFEIDRYIGWGTPADYENYMSTIKYWVRFVHDERCLAK